MEEINVLRKFGLSENEVRVYLVLLELGGTKAGTLMKKLGIYSKTAYELLNKLIEKGIVSYSIKSNIKYYYAVDPEKFLDLLKEQKHQLQETEQDIQEILPLLRQKRELSKELQEANIFEGKMGLKSVFEDTLKRGKEVLVFGGGGKFKEAFGPYSELWHKKRIQCGIELKLLWNQELRDKKDEVLKYKYVDVRFLPKEFDNPAPAIIYGDKVALTVWTEKPLATVIRSKEVSRSFRNYFKLLWKQAKT